MGTHSKFKMPYETIDEISMRLSGTVIRHLGVPVYVLEVHSTPKEGVFKLFLQYKKGEPAVPVEYPNDELDLSPLPPIYTHLGKYNKKSFWIYRKAARQFQQGANGRNTLYCPVGTDAAYALDPSNILIAYSTPAPTVKVSDVMKEYNLGGGKSMALSQHVAMFSFLGSSPEKDCMKVEYRGETIGKLGKREDGSYYLDHNNCSLSLNPWCRIRLSEVGIEM